MVLFGGVRRTGVRSGCGRTGTAAKAHQPRGGSVARETREPRFLRERTVLATKKIRVYELARELGVDNAVIVELSNELKIGVKSHSSSIDEPSADRVRRLADSKGLKREPVSEPEPAPAAPPAEPAAPKAAPRKKVAAPAVEEPLVPAAAVAAEKPAVVRSAHRVVRSSAPPPAPVVPAAPVERPAAAAAPAAPPAPPRPAPNVEERPAARTATPPSSTRPVSGSGKTIPPPPGGGRVPPPPPGPRTSFGSRPGGPRPGPGGGGGAGAPRGGPG